jgi:uncharacterized protein (DUF1015 family)
LDYEANKIKRHEQTLAKKELDRTKMNSAQNANIGPVFLTFRDKQREIAARMAYLSHKIDPYSEVKSDDGV